ncbi:protein scarlet-like isoform X2 [Planococcus citri]|uniref:protein scarlet-like isoform X2 n=1 Tax=Planococcus citri TaxID=170843 RepID=UPI0031F8AB34
MGFDEKIPLVGKRRDESDWRRTSSIVSKGLSVTWTNLNVVAEQKKSSLFKQSTSTFKEIIHNVNGAVEAGTLVAILGASGSGKSTLMTVLANRAPGGLHVNGDIRIGRKRIGGFIKYVSGFVYQDDLFIPTLTVFEHLNFMAKLRLDKDMGDEARKDLIYEVLTELGLMKVAHSRIGNSKFGNEKMNLSGGERKRLSVATELLTDPSLLFCDEPTTGLDSFTALKVVSSLQHLVNERQKTIICSIHQPNDKIFALFNRIILLSKGKMAFSGNSAEALEFFKSQGYPYSEEQNPADYLVKSMAVIADKEEGANQLCSAFENTSYHEKMMKYIDIEHRNENDVDPLVYRSSNGNGPTWPTKLWYVTHRSYLSIVRDSSVQNMRIIQKLLLGLLVGVCMGGSIEATQTGLQAIKGVLFVLVGQNFFPAIHAAMDHVPKQMPIFFREYANSTTTPLIFYLANVLSLLPGFLFDPLSFTILVYWLTNLQPELWAWSLTCLITALVLNISAGFGMLMSTVFSRRDIAAACTTPIDNTYIVCSGVFIKLSTIPPILRWVRYISWFTYAIETLFIIHTGGLDNIECPENTDVPCLRNGTEVLASFDFDESNLVPNVCKMFGIYFFMHIVAYIGLLNRIRTRKI